jgi:glutamate/tyrosine decarboxylase-like PLP-dependent enzyme
MVAEMLAAGLNANVGGRDHAPMEVERQVVGWVRAIFGFPEDAAGLFVTGTSMANLIAVKAARDWALNGPEGTGARERGVGGAYGSRLRAYTSAATHGSVAKAMDVTGLGSGALRKVPTGGMAKDGIAKDGAFRVDVAALAKAIREDRRMGLLPFLVVGTVGTVDTGAVDDLEALAELCDSEGLWLHVDGAFGALAVLAEDLDAGVRARMSGLKRADSLAFDFHKLGQVPYDAGFVLVRDGELLQAAFASGAGYLERETRGMAAGAVWPCDLGPNLSRGFQALKTWFTLKVHGTAALGAAIAKSCRLARSLAERIAGIEELELMAPVELNIVCFRYRAGTDETGAASDADEDELNRQIAIELQVCGSVAPSTTRIGGRVAIRAAIVNHRTSELEIETLVEQTLAFGRMLALRGVSAFGPVLARTVAKEQPALNPDESEEARMADGTLVEKALDEKLGREQVETLFAQACLLEKKGRSDEARTVYRSLLERDAAHLGALTNLGNILFSAWEIAEAKSLYERAVAAYPQHPPSRANLGNLLVKTGAIEVAREHFLAALAIDPEYRPAHAGLSFVLGDLGDPEQAAWHRQRAFADRCVVVAAYRGEKTPIRVLELVSTTGGNMRTDDFLNDRVFQRILVTTEFFDAKVVLPPHDLVVNAIGEADSAGAALAGALAVMERTTAPVINAPAAVMATGRCEVARRLGSIPGVVTARTVTLGRDVLLGEEAGAALAGFAFPLLVRSPGFHGGEHFERVEAVEELAAAVAGLPGSELMVMEYLDARGPDGKCRKYRVMMVDGRLYPLHVAISAKWKIHYFSADMAESAANRAEDAAFLDAMAGVLGERAMGALEAIARTLGLDYGGIDFGLNELGEVLLFEANATMAVLVPEKDERWAYRRPAVERIYKAVWEMLYERARRGTGGVRAA